jgi:hypothetical protein
MSGQLKIRWIPYLIDAWIMELRFYCRLNLAAQSRTTTSGAEMVADGAETRNRWPSGVTS